jgi:diguanylate cyclase (GGDEF)-like protein
VTVSIGVATHVPGDKRTPESLVGAADEALYVAKRAGRNRVEVAS